MIYTDKDGVQVEATQLDAPRILNTAFGECAAEPGSWVVTIPGMDRPAVFSAAAFAETFQPVE